MSVEDSHTTRAIGPTHGIIELSLPLSTCILPSESPRPHIIPFEVYNLEAYTILGRSRKLTHSYSILPALAFSLDMFQKTGSNYGVNEVLLSSVLGSVVFSLFAAQPLVIVGVTGNLTSVQLQSIKTI
jgi:hypothetical protein